MKLQGDGLIQWNDEADDKKLGIFGTFINHDLKDPSYKPKPNKKLTMKGKESFINEIEMQLEKAKTVAF